MCQALTLLSDNWIKKQEMLHSHVIAHAQTQNIPAPTLKVKPLWIHVDCDIFGNEEIILGLYSTFKTPVYLSPYRYGLYQVMLEGIADDCQAEYMSMDIPFNFMDCITCDPRSTAIHSCAINDDWCPLCIEMRQQEDTEGFVDVRCSSYSWELFKLDSIRNTLVIREKMGRFLSLDGTEMIPCVRFNDKPDLKFHPQPILHVLWAMHSSFQELLDFVKRVAPITVHPCVMHRGNAETDDSMDLFRTSDTIRIGGMINLFHPVLRQPPPVEKSPSVAAPNDVSYSTMDTFRYKTSSPISSAFTSPRPASPPPAHVFLRLSVTPSSQGDNQALCESQPQKSQSQHSQSQGDSQGGSQGGKPMDKLRSPSQGDVTVPNSKDPENVKPQTKVVVSQGSIICLDTPDGSPTKVLVQATPNKSPLFNSPEVKANREIWRAVFKSPTPIVKHASGDVVTESYDESWISPAEKKRRLNLPPSSSCLDCT